MLLEEIIQRSVLFYDFNKYISQFSFDEYLEECEESVDAIYRFLGGMVYNRLKKNT